MKDTGIDSELNANQMSEMSLAMTFSAFLLISFPFCKASSLNEVAGILLFSGSVSSYAFLNSKEPMSQAVSDIKV